MIKIENIGEDDRIPYAKADLIKVCRLGMDYAISFYQFDYQSMANITKEGSSLTPENFKDRLLPVSKIVMNEQTYELFKKELSNIDDLIKKKMDTLQ